jgi:hypothetical protein
MVRIVREKKGGKRAGDSGKSGHRLGAEKKMGRRLKRGEVVHYKKRTKGNKPRKKLSMFRSRKPHPRSKKRTGRW